MTDKKKWKQLIKIAKREGKSASELLQDYVEHYVSLHAPGNPQTLMSSFGRGGKITISNIEGRVRQLCMESSDPIPYGTILEIEKEEGIFDGSMRMAMAKRVVDWLRNQGRTVLY
jgi:hypothetical protein